MLDTNNDGVLSRCELINGFYSISKDMKKAENDVDEIIKQLDVNKDGSINYTEFLMAHLKVQEIVTEEKL